MTKIWLSVFCYTDLWIHGDLWVTSGLQGIPFPKWVDLRYLREDVKRTADVLNWYVMTVMITCDLTWTMIFSSLASMSFTQDMLRYVASQVRFSGAYLDDRGGSRPLDPSLSTAFQYPFYVSFPVNLPGCPKRFSNNIFNKNVLCGSATYCFFYNLRRRKWLIDIIIWQW